MTIHALTEIANAMVTEGKGLLAMDESTDTCNRRFASADISQTEAARPGSLGRRRHAPYCRTSRPIAPSSMQ
ncbi:fructose-bisphosphate aldolase class I [Pusillimonas sp. ANT_WB101]|nr:class I fructose-bisphosphate aldolase [Pusillimonas sp. ANT_WB101]KAA0890611.1 fructose-bisphosphate aldolase class I [Pusillimonas sp. ANT_WB101]